MWRAAGEARERRLPLVERADEESAVEHDDGYDGDRRGDELAVEVGRRRRR